MSAGAVRGGERKQKMTVLRHMGLSIGARVPLNPQTHTLDSRTPPPLSETEDRINLGILF